jgi:hypothetical protein
MATTPEPSMIEDISSKYMPSVFREILDRASQYSGDHPPEYRDLVRAFDDYFADKPRQIISPISFWREHLFLVVTSALMVIFGILGIWANSSQQGSDLAAGIIDIAKILAGAVVGSAAAPSLAKPSRSRVTEDGSRSG